MSYYPLGSVSPTNSFLVEEERVLVVGLDELVLADAAAEAEDVGHVVLLPLQVLRDDLVRLLAVALLVAPKNKMRKHIKYYSVFNISFQDITLIILR